MTHSFKSKRLIFVGGVHRSGTSLIHRIIRSNSRVSGFCATNVPQDEGQHLQSVIPPASKFGGPGRFGRHPSAAMDENHPLASEDTTRGLFAEWSEHWDLSRDVLVEKSPPNILRSRFLHKIFPDSSFVMTLRHPLAVAYATVKWCPDPLLRLVDHTLLCYERLLVDAQLLADISIVRYESLVAQPIQVTERLLGRLRLPVEPLMERVVSDRERAYLGRWRMDLTEASAASLDEIKRLDRRARAFGYCLDPEDPYCHSDGQETVTDARWACD